VPYGAHRRRVILQLRVRTLCFAGVTSAVGEHSRAARLRRFVRVANYVIAVDEPLATDVRELVSRHLHFAGSQSPPENVFALDADGLLDPAVTFYSCRRSGELLAIAALKHLSDRHGELKSMHTATAARRQGLGRSMLGYLIRVGQERGYQLLSLETGSMDGFAPARALYASAGFTECGAFASYQPSPHSIFMSLPLQQRPVCQPPGATR
jgi:putative acetyltransferase